MEKDEFKRLSAWLAEKHFPLKEKWLKSCVEYLNHSFGRKLSVSEAFHLVVQQFIDSKIGETLNPVMKIPTNAVKVILVKRMIFEVISFTNISISLYEQLSECTRHNDDLSWFHGGEKLEIEEENRENATEKYKKRRGMLKLEVTDGQNTLKAIELEEIFDENALNPGAKLLLTGKITCRRGILLLNKSNCLMIGGRLETIDKVKKLSEALKIDLDSVKKRRKDSLEKAAAAVTQKKADKKNNNSTLNQSSISPFLVKTSRKTGEILNPPLAPADPPSPENWDYPIEEIPTPRPKNPKIPKEIEEITWTPPPPPPPPTKRLSSLKIGHQKDQKEPRKSKENTLNSTSSMEKLAEKQAEISGKSTKIQKNSTKKLPEQLLRPTLGSPSMPVERRKEISEWVWEDRRGSEEEEVPTKRKKDDSIMEIPDCFLRQIKTEPPHELDPVKMRINRSIHGPRKGIVDFPVKKKQKEASPVKKITDHFQTVKSSLHPKVTFKSLDPSPLPPPPILTIPLENQMAPPPQPEPMEEQQLEEEAVEMEEEYDEIIPETPYPPSIKGHQNRIPNLREAPLPLTKGHQNTTPTLREAPLIKGHHLNPSMIQNSEDVAEYEGVERGDEDNDDSIMECTIEQEGLQECERWGLVEKNYDRIMDNMVQSHPSNWNFAPEKPLKIEENSGIMMRIPARENSQISSHLSQNSMAEEIKNKQSANVQIYKTPFAKRLKSSNSNENDVIFQRIADLQIVPLADALINRKYWMMSKIVVVMPTICHQLHELKSDGIDWLLQISITDTSAGNIKCRVATDLLNRIFGFNVQQCKNLFNLNRVEELRQKKLDAERKLHGFKRLDLLVWIEVSPEIDKLPLIVDVKTISDALNIL